MSDRSERNNLGGRLARYAQVSSAVGGVAARMAGERLFGLSSEHDQHAADLRAILGGLKGPLMKVAQMLATIPDALPAAYADQLAHLQANAPSMGWPFVQRRMAAELGPDWQGRFRAFDRNASAAASLGQVHRAIGPDGRRLACKLQYPDMASVVEADLGQLKLILGGFERADRAFSTAQVHAEIGARLREELDYRREARHLTLYRGMLAGVEGVVVPEAVPDLSTDRLLTMDWADGTPLLPYARSNPDAANDLAMALFRAWYVPFYYYGVIHGDPHPGNYTVRSDRTLNLLDFGCVRVFRPGFVQGVIDLYRALQADDHEAARASYQRWGFRDPSRELVEVLNIWARFIYAPLLEDRTRRIDETSRGKYGREVAAKVHSELRRLGGIEVPREFVFMDRAAIGLGSVFLHLGAEINWYRLFHDLIQDFDLEALTRRQEKALAEVGLSPSE